MLGDRYELRALLGKGGMAEVHEATAHGAHGFVRRVAIKRLRAETSSDPTVVRMFLDEARIASRLHHACIVAVLDYAVADDVPFQVLELVDGWDVAALMRLAKARGQTLPLDVSLYIATEVAHALSYAHEAKDERGESLGIVHRDVKPSNVLVSRGGDVKLGDFGIALARERAAKTTGFVARGTPGYMSPEQLLGTSIDIRTDVFALGCTVHALLTGWSPLTDESARAALTSGTKLPVAATLPPGVLAIVERAVEVSAAARFATAREMALALGAELQPLLRTDPKSRLMEWLQLLAVPPPSATATITTMGTLGTTVLSVSPHGGTKLASTLTSTDRIFTSRTADMDGPAQQAPTFVSAPPPAFVSRPLTPYASHPPPRLPSAHPTGFGSYPPPRASVLPRTLDATGALAVLPAHVSKPAPPQPRDNRMLVFGVAVMVPIAIAVIGGLGVVVGHQLSKEGTVDGGMVVVAPADGASAPAQGPLAVPDAATPVTTAGAKAKSGATAALDASPGAGGAGAGGVASGLAGTTAPVKGGCICIAQHDGVTTGVCHPQVVRAPRCECKTVDRANMCWVAYSKEGQSTSLCPERKRTMPASARDGQPCVGFSETISFPKNAAGKSEALTSTGPAQNGVLDSCDRCADTGPVYPRTKGAPCVGIVPETGARVEGRVDCL